MSTLVVGAVSAQAEIREKMQCAEGRVPQSSLLVEERSCYVLLDKGVGPDSKDLFSK